jgi:hypothetical protein
MQTRRRFKQTSSLENRLSEAATRLGKEAASLPPGGEHEQILRKARQAETGSQMSEWLRSTETPKAAVLGRDRTRGKLRDNEF